MTLSVRANTSDKFCKNSFAASVLLLPAKLRSWVVVTALAKSSDENGPRNLDSIVVKKESKSSLDFVVKLAYGDLVGDDDDMLMRLTLIVIII
jgi:hypothetical protein